MKIYICSLVSKKNKQFLNSHLNSINQLKKPNNYSFKMVFVIHPKIISYKHLFKKFLNKIDYVVLRSTKDNIPYSRNIFLKFIKDQNFRYAGFLDDDCIVDKDWLLNMIKFINQNNCDIVGGPQKHKVKNIIFKNYYDILEPRRQHGELVRWVATNNCFFSKKIVKSKIFFNTQLASYGGSDQLFFRRLYKKKFIIKWNMKSFTTENYNLQREKKLWFLKRNLRYGYSGNLIDKEIYGKMSLIIIITKIFYLIFSSLILFIIPHRKSNVKASFFLLRAIGRFVGLFSYKPEKYI
jgi:hypothetical protein